MVQDERLGWQRCAASTDLRGAAAAGVLQEVKRQEAGAKGGASRLPLTFCLLTISGLYLGKFPQTPRCNPYSLYLLPTPTPYSLVRCRRRRGRSVSGSSPVSCLFTSCKMPAAALRSAAEAEQSGARRVAQDERLGWQRCSASADQGGAAADRPDSTVHLNLKPKPDPLIQLFPLCRKYDTIYTI